MLRRGWLVLCEFCLLMVIGCAPSRYVVSINGPETSKNHFIIVDQTYGTAYDCYSKPDSMKWCPICREIIMQDHNTWMNEEFPKEQENQQGYKKLK